MMMRITFLKVAILLLSVSLLPGCISGSRSDNEDAPGWVRLPTRTIDGGFIVYVGSADDEILSQANFKARAEAIENIANECSFAPKGARTEDRFQDKTSDGNFRVYIKAAVSFEDCEAAQHAVEPAAIQKLANASFAEELKRYHDLIDQESKQTNDQEVANATPPPASNTAEMDYYANRQQVAMAKEVVILAPVSAYPPGAPQTVQFVSVVRPASVQVIQYQNMNPQIRTTNMGWTSLPYHPAVGSFSGVSGMRSAPMQSSNIYHSINRGRSFRQRQAQGQQGGFRSSGGRFGGGGGRRGFGRRR